MKSTRFVTLVLLLLVVAVYVLNAQTANAPVVTLKRTSCYGPCPIYEVSVFPNGTVSWNGRKFVGTVGVATARISEHDIQILVDAIATGGFRQLNESYRERLNPDGTRTGITDLPTTYLTFTHNGLSKTVEDYAFAPDELHTLELLVDRISNSHQWRHDMSAVMTLEAVEPSYRWTEAEDLKNEPIVREDIYSQTKPGFTKLMQSAGKGDLQGLSKELDSAADVNAMDETGWTALMMAAVAGQPEAIGRLIEHRADVGLADKNGDNALIGVAANPYLYGNPEQQVGVARRLLAAGANVNQANRQGETALMWAAKSGHPELVETLLRAGANPRVRDKAGHDAAYAVQRWLSLRDKDIRRSRYERTLESLRRFQSPTTENNASRQ